MSKSECGSHGGFYAASGASGSNDGPSQGGTAPFLKAPRSRARIEPIIPCCVNQLLTASLVDDVFKVRGIVVSQVSIVGIIRKAERAPNYILYKIDDMTTKPIDARHWLGRSKAKQELAPCPVGVYAKVLGILRGSAEVRILEVLQIRVLEDMNEFTAHILETVNAHMMLAKAQEEAYGQSAPSAPPEAAQAPEPREVRPQVIQAEVLRLIRECPHQEGKSVGELQADLGSLSIKAIKDALEYLMVEGHIYPTVDGQHFKSAD
ncbi:Replication protein A 30 kDa subunit [Myotis brandtii]|uniref:Replication protein A 30 kDa subunit n=1 Tax=Myotis brandtii TaxID=109478 RepID=S7PEC5_MYOBR|nr:PREDICTED: replication protein A 30 kDa subunit [Myotis brandtii]EPQ08843.1 Replication protein A 30 kDa subunit [Myotis brandtii]